MITGHMKWSEIEDRSMRKLWDGVYTAARVELFCDSTKKVVHPCGNCVWRGFSDDNVPGCFKYQKPVNKDCDEKKEE
jgi:hypothetical protein